MVVVTVTYVILTTWDCKQHLDQMREHWLPDADLKFMQEIDDEEVMVVLPYPCQSFWECILLCLLIGRSKIEYICTYLGGYHWMSCEGTLYLCAHDLTPFLKHGFACLLNILAPWRIVNMNFLAMLSIGCRAYTVYVCLQNEAPWAWIPPKVFDGGKKNSGLYVP